MYEGVLSGVRVVDLSRFISGPWATMLMGDMGADVVKVERPGRGDDARVCGPFSDGQSLFYAVYNRNKRSVTLDLRSEAGLAILRRLIAGADLVVENFRPGVLDSMGLGYDAIRAMNSRTILVSISGFGQTGPYADRPCFDTIAQAMSGLMDLTGTPDGPPMRAGVFVADFLGGLYAALGASSALHERCRSGTGCHVDVAMLDGVVSLLETNLAEYALTGQRPSRSGNRRPFAAPVNCFRASDGFVFINVSTDDQWRRLCHVIARQDLVDDSRFATPYQRGENYVEIEAAVDAWIGDLPKARAVELLNGSSVPASVVAGVDDVLANPQLAYRRSLLSVAVPGIGDVVMPANPVRISVDPDAEARLRPPPWLGQHTDEVLSELGYTPVEIESFRASGVI